MRIGYNLVTISVIILLINMNWGQKIKIRTVSGGLGMNLVEGNYGIGVVPEAEIGLGSILKDIYLHPYIAFGYNSFSREDMRFSLKQFLLGVKLLYYLDYKYEGFYLGGGVSYHLLYPDYAKRHTISNMLYKQESIESRAGFSALAGYILDYGTLWPYSELKLYFVPNGFSSLQLSVGIFYKL